MAEEDRPARAALTGLPMVDEVTGGLEPGKLWMHAARVGEQKTNWMLNWAVHASSRPVGSANVLFVSYEEPGDTLVYRYRAMRAGLDVARVRSGDLNEAEERALEATWLSGGKFAATSETWDRPLGALAKAEFPIDLLIVDHAALATPERRVDRERDRIREVYQDAKRLALGTDTGRPIGVVMTHQLNRASVPENGGVVVDDVVSDLADVITTTWQHPILARGGLVHFRMLQNRCRTGRLIAPLVLQINAATRRMHYLRDVEQG